VLCNHDRLCIFDGLVSRIDAGGKIFVLGIFGGLLVAIITCISAIFDYMIYTLNVIPLSYPFFTEELTNMIFGSMWLNYTVAAVIGWTVVVFSAYFCM
jgi:hypothetical protein